MRYFQVVCLGFFFLCPPLTAQAPEQSSSSEIYHALQKLNFLGNALYVAAHPDDENTRIISYLSNHIKANTAYLSITRGDGGQNLIGPELRELLGVLRTQELLAARKIDGGKQFFTRAVDFGYSKHPDETLELWGKEEVLSDVVRVIREFKPDVIINRFDHRSPGSTHGHHTSSAMLSLQAFEAAADPSRYPAQLESTEVWKPSRIFFNTSWWFYGSEENFEKADKSKLLPLDVGLYYPLIGKSNNEIAALASSQHRCQGFGRVSERGSEQEYVELIETRIPGMPASLFEGINTKWDRMQGGAAIGAVLYAVEENFDFRDPSTHLPQLLEAHKLLSEAPESHWKNQKIAELQELITALCGLYLEANAENATSYPGGTEKVVVRVLNRSKADIRLKSIALSPEARLQPEAALEHNRNFTAEISLPIPEDTPYTSPYWLSEKGSVGSYKVTDPSLIGKPETARAFQAVFSLELEGYPMEIRIPLVHKYAKPEIGEIVEPFEILPPATAGIPEKVLIFPDGEPRKIPVIVKSNKDSLRGSLRFQHPPGWAVEPAEQDFEIGQKGEEKTLWIELTPPAGEAEGRLVPLLEIEGKAISKELVTIAYDHIPTQAVLLPSESRVVRLDLRKAGELIGYIAGAGDLVPESLRQIGYQVQMIDPSAIQPGNLEAYDAIVVGIRAYNVVDELRYKQKHLLEYVKNGGNLIIQYNTSWRGNLNIENLAPFPLQISRDRVTDENSEVAILAREHPLVNFPNRITGSDFDGWVQERGLYFPDQWDEAFTPILSMNDPGEPPTKGSLLVAPYGKGNYIYTGLSFFRELPEGVPGAYKLFANMISLGKDKISTETAVKG